LAFLFQKRLMINGEMTIAEKTRSTMKMRSQAYRLSKKGEKIMVP
jgi:hypothetical protein